MHVALAHSSTKALSKKEGPKICLICTKNGDFSQLPSYFVASLGIHYFIRKEWVIEIKRIARKIAGLL